MKIYLTYFLLQPLNFFFLVSLIFYSTGSANAQILFETELRASDGAMYNEFGTSVSQLSDTAVVGAAG